MSKPARTHKAKPPRKPVARAVAEDSADYVDWSTAKRVTLPNLKPSTTTISLRLPMSMLDELKVLANQRDVPYQSLLKVLLSERMAELRGAKRRSGA